MTVAVLALGSNLGDRAANLRAARAALAQTPDLSVTAASPIYQTAPVGGIAQEDFYNAVLLVETKLAPEALLTRCLAIEDELGRIRTVRWGPRVIDIDLVEIGGIRRDDERLILPHPRAKDRAFVLVPWLAVDPEAQLTGAGRVRDLLRGLPVAEVRPVGLGWEP